MRTDQPVCILKVNSWYIGCSTKNEVELISNLDFLGVRFTFITADERCLTQLAQTFSSSTVINRKHGDIFPNSSGAYNSADLNFSPTEISFLRNIFNRYSIFWGSFNSFLKKASSDMRFWLSEASSTELVLFNGYPHHLYSALIYFSCNRLEVPFVFFEKTMLPGFSIMKRYISSAKPIRLNFVYLSDLQNVEWKDLRPFWLDRKRIEFAPNPRVKASFNMTQALSRSKFNCPKGMYFFWFSDGNLPGLLSLAVAIWRRLYRKFLEMFARVLSSTTPKEDSVIMYLQCEPEKNAFPTSGKYTQTQWMQMVISSCKRVGTRCYFKEHPSQFRNWQSADLGRSMWFYIAVLIRGGRFLPATYDLALDHRRHYVFSTSGSIVFELLSAGRVAFFSGHPWYEAIFPEFKLDESADLDNSIKRWARKKVSECENYTDKRSMGWFFGNFGVKLNVSHWSNVDIPVDVDRIYRAISGVLRDAKAK